MTPKEILHAAQGLNFKDLVYLVSQLMQLLEAQVSKAGASIDSSKNPSVDSEQPTSTAAVGIIADLIKNPVAFDGSPLTREEIYER